MEFGLMAQGWLPKDMQEGGGSDVEHKVLMDDFERVLAAEKAGFKYAWISEHHFLDEYSHISSSDVFIAALLQATSTIHVGSASSTRCPRFITRRRSPSGSRCSTTSDGRFEFDTYPTHRTTCLREAAASAAVPA